MFLGISFEEKKLTPTEPLKLGKVFAITMIIWFSQLGEQCVPHPSLVLNDRLNALLTQLILFTIANLKSGTRLMIKSQIFLQQGHCV